MRSLVAVREQLRGQCEGPAIEGRENHIELCICKLDDVTILSGYASPRTNQGRLLEALRNCIPEPVPEALLIVGDFKVNLQDAENSRRLVDFMSNVGLRSLLPPEASTTNLNTQIDVAFSNIQHVRARVYECATSHHKPLFITF